MQNAEQSLQSRIVSYAEAIKREGGTYAEAAEKLDISTDTLRRYRNGYADYEEGTGYPEVSPQVREKMNRGGKLTQLEQNAPTPGDQVVPEDLSVSTDEVMERPEFASPFASMLGQGEILQLDELDDPIEVKVTARKYEFEDGDFQWVIGGTQDVGELTETRERVFSVGSDQDERHLAGKVNPWLAESGIIDSPEALPSERGMRKVS
jgi:hypothetical protein